MLRVATHHAKRALSVPQYYGAGLAKVFMTEPVFLWAQAIAFKTLVTLLPLILLATGIFGLVLRQEDPFTTVSSFLREFLPAGQSDGLVELVLALQGASGTITVFGAVFLLVTIVTLFSTLRYVVGAAMGETRHRMRTLLGGYVFDLRMAAQVGGLFLVSFFITASARFLGARSGEMASQVGLDVATVEAVTGGLLQAVTIVIPYVLTVGMLVQLYRFVPRPHPPFRSALFGAAAAAVLFELAKNGFALYATHVADFDRYSDAGAEGLGGLGGVFGLILAFVFWVYFSGIILVVGAVVGSLHEKRTRPRRHTLRRMWSRMGSFRKYRERTKAEDEEAAAEEAAAEEAAASPDADPLAADSAGRRAQRRRRGRPAPLGHRPPRPPAVRDGAVNGAPARRALASARPPRPRVTVRPILALAALAALAAPARAQVPLTLVNDSTTVGSLGFAFEDGQTLLVANLELQIATVAPPGFLGRLLGAGGGVYPFLPVEVAKDAVRLTRYYNDNGFPLADVDYAVVLDTTDNTAAVTFEVTEGPPLLIEDVSFAGPGQADVRDRLAPEVRDGWGRFTRGVSVRSGDRLDAFALVQLQSQTVAWLRNRGYAWADAGAERFVDSTGLRADVRVKVNVGPRVRVGSVRVEGDSSMSASTITREVPLQAGDLFDAGALAEGQREVFGLGLFTLALVDVAPEAVRGDTVVPVVVRVRRGPSRVATAFGGFFSEGRLTARGSFTHRNAFGGARQLGVNVEARTGQPDVSLPAFLGGSERSVTGGPITDYRVAVPFRQPYVFDRRLSYTFQPSYRIRDDEIESSVTAEIANTLLFTVAPLKTAALSLTGRTRDLSRGLGIRILDAGAFALPPGPLLPDSLRATAGGLGLDVVWGSLNDPLQPTRGAVFRPSLSLVGGDVTYGRGRLAASALRPLGRRRGLAVRATVGGLLPFGGTSPDDLGDYVLFRDQLFYAGGTTDVRGWPSARLGPKTFSVTPPVRVAGQVPDPSRIESARDVNYVGVGGRYKASASVQVNLPLPLGPQWGWNLFADAGGVWGASDVPSDDLVRAGGAPADRTLAQVLEAEGGLRVGVGAGLSYLTPVGFVSVAAAFKANPSYLDEREPARVYCGDSIYDPPEGEDPSCFGGAEVDDPGSGAARGYIDARLNGSDFDPDLIPKRTLLGVGVLDAAFRRLQLHIAIGQTF